MNLLSAALPNPVAETAQAQLRMAQLVARLPVHRAFHWLHLHQPQLRAWQLEFLAIPAPPFAEAERAAWFLDRFAALGLVEPHLDAAGNALAVLPDQSGGQHLGPYLLLSAHLDTVFPAGTPTAPREDGPRILGPGACDNGAGLAALLGLAAALRFAGIVPPVPILFAANTGEEGEGDLRGMRHLFGVGAQRSPYAGRIGAAVALEGAGSATAVTRALGSRRFRVTISGPGGHSWTDSSAPNPITLLARALAVLADHPLLTFDPASETRTTLSPGQIAGGTSVNSIPASASVDLDLRSTDSVQLDRLTLEMHRAFEQVVAQAGLEAVQPPAYAAPTLQVEPIGDRPAAVLPENAPLLHSLRAADRHLGLRTDLRLGSTDANVPLSLGIPAVALSAGGSGGGIHTLAEWYDPTGRELALRRILLVLLDLAQTLI